MGLGYKTIGLGDNSSDKRILEEEIVIEGCYDRLKFPKRLKILMVFNLLLFCASILLFAASWSRDLGPNSGVKATSYYCLYPFYFLGSPADSSKPRYLRI